MKRNSISLVILSLLSTAALADGFTVQQDSPTISHSLELQSYVKSISRYQPETVGLNNRLQKTINYYQRVHILKTVNKKNYTVDCVPFAEQPALIDKPGLAQSLLPNMIKETHEHFDDLKKMGSQFDFNPATECPMGSIALIRPNKTMLTSEKANQKAAPNTPSMGLGSGYTWQQGYTPTGTTIYIDSTTDQAYFKGPQNQYTNPLRSGDHSLNQFWLTADVVHPHLGTETFSVEFGIIASSYFTTDEATTIFTFASIDNYGNNSCYDLYCPNFVQAPGSIPLGAPIANKNADYLFQVTHKESTGSQPGFYLTLISHNALKDENANATTLIGFYPDSLYTLPDRPHQFSAGAEVYADSPGNGTIMYGNYANPYAGYNAPKVIGMYSQNGNNFPSSTTIAPAPYGLIWNLGQS